MSKNVAVFVDVANIFYAAKAAGVDIDYVTLLKSATAGRDFVRAYAYTGLDPENENQRQFHQFLARHGYKVVSKDIRKYGDGKVKANLDIELVVDLMKTARNLDIAVVVSGDGDFAPAIRAVQEMGVRVEVVSFRGNTSSDLIDVADLFTDITQIAKVEKGAGRSGRRVAAEDDLSMTAVPDKESEGAPRRRRGGRGRAAAAEEEAAPTRRRTRAEPAGAGLVALPGEKLSRSPGRAAAAGAEGEAVELEEAVAEGADEVGEAGEAGQENGGPRRRRRRGGRGRGRGRGAERGLPGEEPTGEEEGELEAYAPPRAPQSTPFGSVWDSQLGVPAGPVLAGEALEEVYEDEPEIPEYLLAERRQRGTRQPRGGQRGRGRGGAYQAALERERFGRSGTGGTGGSPYGAPAGRSGRGPNQGRGHGGGRGGRPERTPRPYAEPRVPSGGDGDPWSEVPPELEAMLRAELARRPAEHGQARVEAAPHAARPRSPEASAEAGAAPARAATRRRGGRTTKPAEEAAAADSGVTGAGSAEAAPAKRGRTARSTAATEAATPSAGAEGAPPPKRTRSTRTKATPVEGESATGTAAAAPKRTRSTRNKATAEA